MNLNYRLRDSDIPTDTGSNSTVARRQKERYLIVVFHFFFFFKVRYSKLSVPYACNCKSSNSCDLVLECGTRFSSLEGNEGGKKERKKEE